MNDLFKDILPALIGVVFCAWWWFIAKEATSRKYILLLGICWLVLGIAYNIGKSFDISALMVMCGFIFLGVIYFFIRAALSEHKARKKSPDD
jgi:hypothetical protein